MLARITARLAAATVIVIAAEKTAVTAAEYEYKNNYYPNPLAASVVAAVVSAEKSHKNTSFLRICSVYYAKGGSLVTLVFREKCKCLRRFL